MDSDKTLVLVCGAARSGTTMLDLMLGNSDEAFSTGEIYALFRPFRAHHFGPVCNCGDPQCAVWADLRHVPERELHQQASRQPGISYVIDSSKDLRWVLDSNRWAASSGLQVRNLLIWKDPIDLAYSHWKRGRPVDYFRKAFVDYYQRFLALNLPFASISYSRLVVDEVKILAMICQYLGMPENPGRSEFWHKQHHHFFGSAGTASQVGKGSSTLSLQRDFPDEFNSAYQQYLQASGADNELNELIIRLEAHEIANPDRLVADVAAVAPSRLTRPGWYYRHALKALYRKHFPEREAVVD
jgi:hypothetical protein